MFRRQTVFHSMHDGRVAVKSISLQVQARDGEVVEVIEVRAHISMENTTNQIARR